VHARGNAAHGYFVCDTNLEDLTIAKLFGSPGKKTPIFLRFSTVLGSKGSADTVRDVRGFAVKFYTEEGNFDIVGNNIPVFFIQDAIKFADIIHAGKPEPHNEIPQAATGHDNFWDFVSLTPETTHMITWIMSDRTLPRSHRMMQGFGVHSFVMYNKHGERTFVKFHFTPKLGVKSFVFDEASKLAGADPDFHRRDLWDAIEAGKFPEWDLSIQVVEEKDENDFDFDLLDATKIIPEDLVPRRHVGRIVLNRNPDNYFAETEQVAYHTGHLVPGIAPSNDPLLQGRMFSYIDTQVSRLGGMNFEEIPINRPLCPFHNNQRDGFHRQTINKGKVNYSPNRFDSPREASQSEGGYVHPPTFVVGPKVRARGPKFAEHFNQARKFYISLCDWEQEHLTQALIFELSHVMDKGIKERMIKNLNHVDHDLACKVAKMIGLDSPKAVVHNPFVRKSPYLSQVEFQGVPSIATRKIAFLFAAGFSGPQSKALKEFVEAHGAMAVNIGPHVGELADDQGNYVPIQATYTNTKSVQYDAVVIVGGQRHVDTLKEVGPILAFVNEAYKHGKPIIATEEGIQLLHDLRWDGISLASNKEDFELSHGVLTTTYYDNQQKFNQAVFNTIAAHKYPERDTRRVPA